MRSAAVPAERVWQGVVQPGGGSLAPPDLLSCTSFLPACHLAAVPEMQRSDLSGTVLQLKSLGIDNIMTFEWLAPPPAEVGRQRPQRPLHSLCLHGYQGRNRKPAGGAL